MPADATGCGEVLVHLIDPEAAPAGSRKRQTLLYWADQATGAAAGGPAVGSGGAAAGGAAGGGAAGGAAAGGSQARFLDNSDCR